MPERSTMVSNMVSRDKLDSILEYSVNGRPRIHCLSAKAFGAPQESDKTRLFSASRSLSNCLRSIRAT